MKLTVITINRNNRQGLERTLASIGSVVLPEGVELEHIVVDGESTDGSLELVDTSRSRILSAPPRGVYDALNKGIEVATGDIVGFLHAGDVYADNGSLVKLLAPIINPETACDFVWSDVTIGRRYFSGAGFPEILKDGSQPPHPSLYARRRVYETVGLYDATYRTGGDLEFFVRLFRTTQLRGIYVPGESISMEPGGLSSTLKARLYTNQRERMRTFRRHGMKLSYGRLLIHYKRVLLSFVCSPTKKNK